MLNFTYYCPTKVVFGKDSILNLSTLIPDDVKKVMILYGGGSIKKNGIYESVLNELKTFEIIEFQGIKPNPEYIDCLRASKICKDEKVDFLLAIGGGSVLDATKFIAVLAKFQGDDPWSELVENKLYPSKALKIGSIMTLPASGSEMNSGAVISNKEKKMKQAYINPIMYPNFSIIDPSYTFSLDTRQTINGIIDTFTHVMEQFCTPDVNSPIQDGFSLAILKTLLKEAPLVLKEPKNYEVRANLCWAATCALNNWIGLGVEQDWGTHKIGHELTEIYGIDHAQSLAVILPQELKAKISEKKTKLEMIAKELFNLSEGDLANEAIKKIERFFRSIGAKTKLSEYGIDPKEAATKVEENLEKNKNLGLVLGNITPKEAYNIVLNS